MYRQLVEFIGMALPSARIAIRRAKLDENEFLAVLILTFWFAGNCFFSDIKCVKFYLSVS